MRYLFALLLAPLAALRALTPTQLRCEYLNNPIGIDALQPRLSWVLESKNPRTRGQHQTAYQLLVASSREKLAADKGDLWNSGKIISRESIQIGYSGQPLVTEQICFWKVRAWDQDGKVSSWSEPAFWSMGLLKSSDWQAKWIGLDGTKKSEPFSGADWIWFPEGHAEESAPIGTRYFRRAIEIPKDRALKAAQWVVTGDDQFKAYFNGKQVASGGNFKVLTVLDLLKELKPGTNVLAVSVKNMGENPNPAGLISLVRIEFAEGEPLLIATDETWVSSAEELPGWEKPGYDDSTWLSARKLGPAGMAPWGDLHLPEDRRLPARWVRQEFIVAKKLRRATAHIAGLGLSELYLNGAKVSDQVLSPALSDYTKRVYYGTHDVTRQLRLGKNAVGVVLGNGRFFAPRGPPGTVSYGFPKLLFQLRLEYEDGSEATLLSDRSWKISDQGPIRANNEYDGEEYDARLEMPGWNQPGFQADDRWKDCQEVDAPGGFLGAQMIEPIRVTQTIRPIKLSQPKPGVYVFDVGQNMVGWCRLHVKGSAGTTIRLRHAETLQTNGMLYVDNLRSAKATDLYTLKGKGDEIYEPRFTYHGFRYVELTGCTTPPTLATIEGRVVHDDLESAGEFGCSNPLLNRIYENIRWGVRGNYRSIPTDCPQRDERQGWLGDRAAESRGESYMFDIAGLYGKWLQDMADAQKATGSVPDVCPAYWPLYSDNVTWPSCTVLIPGMLLDQYGDISVLARHYPSARLWMDYMNNFVTNGIISRDSYGDWCVPPEEPHLIHSKDPKRQTNKALLATAYLYYDATLMADYARRQGRIEDAQRFAELAAALQKAFNARFMNRDEGCYDNGSQTSSVLPLAFELALGKFREELLPRLTRQIHEENQGHTGTGLIGGQWLMRVLTEGGKPDVAYEIATQETYPSWGYMVKKDATTIWELWNGDTADPAMNSGNHVMLVGDLTIWLFENLAGIKPDSEQPGFKRLIMKPETPGNLSYVRATHKSPYGLIVSDWKKDAKGFHWNVTVPVNTTATLYVPARRAESVREDGKPVSRAKELKVLRFDNGRAVMEVGSGVYRFESE